MRNIAVLPQIKGKFRIALLRITAFEQISAPQLMTDGTVLVHISSPDTGDVGLMGRAG